MKENCSLLTNRKYKFEVNLPALFGSHTSGFTFEGKQCQTLERSLWVNWMSIKPGDDYYQCTFYEYVPLQTSPPMSNYFANNKKPIWLQWKENRPFHQ